MNCASICYGRPLDLSLPEPLNSRTPRGANLRNQVSPRNEAAHSRAFQPYVKTDQFTDLLVSEPKLAPAGERGHWICHPLHTPQGHFFQTRLSPEARCGLSYLLRVCLWALEEFFLAGGQSHCLCPPCANHGASGPQLGGRLLPN